MMKNIEIKGSSNVKKLLPEQYNNKKKGTENWDIPDSYLLLDKQLQLINCLYLNQDIASKEMLKKAINKKLSSYKQQDIKNKIYGENFFISFDNTIEKLVECKMRCYYCNNKLRLIYEEIKDDNQWTLDRINNDMGHNDNNVLISCLKCNLKRRNINHEKFKFTKNLNIVKNK